MATFAITRENGDRYNSERDAWVNPKGVWDEYETHDEAAHCVKYYRLGDEAKVVMIEGEKGTA